MRVLEPVLAVAHERGRYLAYLTDARACEGHLALVEAESDGVARHRGDPADDGRAVAQLHHVNDRGVGQAYRIERSTLGFEGQRERETQECQQVAAMHEVSSVRYFY